MSPLPNGLDLLTSMITPAVLISACGTLIFSTSTRLARVVDRVRELSHSMEANFRGEVAPQVPGLVEPDPWERLWRLFQREAGNGRKD